MAYLQHLFEQLTSIIDTLGYLGIILLMAIESSFLPLPSEIVMIPAGYLVKQGKMDAVLAVLSGTFGSLLGAYINYYLSATLGRKFILKYGHWLLLDQDKFLKIEQAFLRHGNFATFVGRLIFGVRHWISIPAGLSRMPLLPFSFLTTIGAAIWVTILVGLGYSMGMGETTIETAKMVGYWLLGAVVIISAAYIAWWVPRKNGKNENATCESSCSERRVNGTAT